jgi:VWFA-related protein
LFALGVAFSYYSSYAQRIHEGRETMPADVLRLRFPTFLFAALCLIIVATSSALSQDRQSTKQSRPRRVSSQTNTEQNNPSQPDSSSEVGEGDVLRVDTQLVTVPAVVTDQNGRSITGLRAENFAVFEDNKPQLITNFATTDAPFEIALLLDTSGSTRAELNLIRNAASQFLNVLRTGDRVAIVAFRNVLRDNSQVATAELLTSLTNDHQTLRRAIDNIGTSNGTPYYDSLVRIATDVFRDPQRQQMLGRRAVVALTDGVDSSSDSEYAQAHQKLLQTGLACYFIKVNTEDYVEDRLLKDCQDQGRLSLSGQQLERFRQLFDPEARRELYQDFCLLGQFSRLTISRKLYSLARREMDELARASGGRNFDVASLSEASAAFTQVANEIGRQYSLGYYPTNKLRDGHFRRIRVELRNVNDASVRAREGYYVPTQQTALSATSNP